MPYSNLSRFGAALLACTAIAGCNTTTSGGAVGGGGGGGAGGAGRQRDSRISQFFLRH